MSEHIAFQRALVADMNLVLHRNRLLTDFVMVDRRDGARLTRGTMFDRHAVLCIVVQDKDPQP